VRRARALNKKAIIGADIIALQAVEQFFLYTGVRPTDDQVRRAAQYSRA
jgi:shikimate dehydrogenase